MHSTLYSCQISIKLEFSRLIFEKKSTQISNFTEIRPVGSLFAVLQRRLKRQIARITINGKTIINTYYGRLILGSGQDSSGTFFGNISRGVVNILNLK